MQPSRARGLDLYEQDIHTSPYTGLYTSLHAKTILQILEDPNNICEFQRIVADFLMLTNELFRFLNVTLNLSTRLLSAERFPIRFEATD